MTTAAATRKAIGIVRVSETKGREGDSFVSPTEQASRIKEFCKRDRLKLVETIEEMDVSGGTPLEKRDGLRRAVEAVEAGEVQVIVAAYFDRLVRSLRVQDELVSRVEGAGGQVFAVDTGQVTNGTAGQWLTSTMIGMASEYLRRTISERTRSTIAERVASGIAPWPKIPPGYKRGDDGVLVPDPETRQAVVEAFEMRAGGASWTEVREHLLANGITRSYHGVGSLLRSRVMLGEVNFGKMHNPDAHEGIVDRELWQQAQRVRAPSGRKGKSERLLARLGVLRCGTCGGGLVVGNGRNNGRSYPFYRCEQVPDRCAHRVTVSAKLAEGVVTDAVRGALADEEGRASAAAVVREAAGERSAAQEKLDHAIKTLADLTDEPAAVETITKLRTARDAAQEKVDQLGGTGAVVTVNADADWDRLTLGERRDLIRATVESVTVAPGRGIGRVSVKLFGE
jgi:DNA invertase Pin-like site-specific DNA recombinase